MASSLVDVRIRQRLVAHKSYNYRPADDCRLVTELQKLEKVVEWAQEPVFSRIGRSALYIFKEPIYLPSIGHSIGAAKVKGVGAKTHLGNSIQPTSIPLHNKNPHLGFKGDEFRRAFTTPAPIGGITLERAEREFQVAKGLISNQCPSVIPLQVYKYTEQGMVFYPHKDGEAFPLGAVITGLPNSHDLRVDSVFKYYELSEEHKATIKDWMEKLNIDSTQNPALCLISELSELYGKTIRKFSESGFYRYSGAPDNYSYNTETGEVFLIDLDSSLELHELPRVQQPLEIMRDAASGIAYLIAFLTNPNYIKNFPVEEVLIDNPFQKLLMGYYFDVDVEYIKHLSKLVICYYEKVYQNSLKQLSANNYHGVETNLTSKDCSIGLEVEIYQLQNFISQSYMRPWLDRAEAFSHIMPICLLLHKESMLMTKFPEVVTMSHMLSAIEKYTSSETSRVISTQIQHLIGSVN